MDAPNSPAFLLNFIVNRIDVGVFVVDRDMRIVLWNRYMETHSGRRAGELEGKSLFECFPELPRKWLERKIQSVFVIKNFAFTSWQQRPFLFRFRHHRPITGGADPMSQDCTFLPVKNESGDVDYVCITLIDVTDTSVYEGMLKDAMASLKESSLRDGMTGVLNRTELERRLDHEFRMGRRYDRSLSFAMLDLDYFKDVNDTYGHLAGDEVLCEVARRCLEIMRDTDSVGRYGGEEFGILLPGETIYEALIATERLRTAVAEQPIQFKRQSISVTLSAGVTQLRTDTKGHEGLIHEADLALYESKEKGRNRTTCFVPE